jgi:hypothetical protein
MPQRPAARWELRSHSHGLPLTPYVSRDKQGLVVYLLTPRAWRGAAAVGTGERSFPAWSTAGCPRNAPCGAAGGVEGVRRDKAARWSECKSRTTKE